jgi:ABC-2 type transport system ATP-binding protein
MMVIETIGLTKQYRGKGGCKNICLSVSEGQIFGFLGPNGAGKSTLVKTLVGLLKPTEGKAFLFGKPLGDIRVRKRIGYLPENFRYQNYLSGLDLLYFHGRLCGMSKDEIRSHIPKVLELTAMKGREQAKVGTYSKGMQQRIGLACALISDPDLLFLDEPTSALDPIGRIEVREIIRELRDRGKTVFLNSHLLSEVEMVCDHLSFIKNGSIVSQGTKSELLAKSMKVKITLGESHRGEILRKFFPEASCRDGQLEVEVKNREQIPRIVATIVENGGEIYQVVPESNSLEELFIRLIGEESVL